MLLRSSGERYSTMSVCPRGPRNRPADTGNRTAVCELGTAKSADSWMIGLVGLNGQESEMNEPLDHEAAPKGIESIGTLNQLK